MTQNYLRQGMDRIHECPMLVGWAHTVNRDVRKETISSAQIH